MGYETTAIFVASTKNFKGWCEIIASVEMCKIAYGSMAELINKHDARTTSSDSPLHKLVNDYEKQYDLVFAGGDYTGEMKELSENDRDKEVKKIFDIQRKLDKELPHIHWSDNSRYGQYEDDCGSLLIVVTLDELREAAIKAWHEDYQQNLEFCKKENITDSKYTGYRRFAMLLKAIEMFDSKIWGEEPVKVILWGH